jgi:hypothetical protein
VLKFNGSIITTRDWKQVKKPNVVEQCIESEAEESESEEDETPVVSKIRQIITENLEQDQVKNSFLA